VTIGVAFPDHKSWLRNFLGDGGTITLVGLDGAGRVAVRVRFAG
jgi:hypothetical protein